MSSINAIPDIQIGLLVSSGDNTATLALQTNSSNAVVIGATQNANFTSTGAVTIPAGTTNARPTGVSGMIRYNNTTSKLEVYLGSGWASFP
jgi:hypothetical protein